MSTAQRPVDFAASTCKRLVSTPAPSSDARKRWPHSSPPTAPSTPHLTAKPAARPRSVLAALPPAAVVDGGAAASIRSSSGSSTRTDPPASPASCASSSGVTAGAAGAARRVSACSARRRVWRHDSAASAPLAKWSMMPLACTASSIVSGPPRVMVHANGSGEVLKRAGGAHLPWRRWRGREALASCLLTWHGVYSRAPPPECAEACASRARARKAEPLPRALSKGGNAAGACATRERRAGAARASRQAPWRARACGWSPRRCERLRLQPLSAESAPPLTLFPPLAGAALRATAHAAHAPRGRHAEPAGRALRTQAHATARGLPLARASSNGSSAGLADAGKPKCVARPVCATGPAPHALSRAPDAPAPHRPQRRLVRPLLARGRRHRLCAGGAGLRGACARVRAASTRPRLKPVRSQALYKFVPGINQTLVDTLAKSVRTALAVHHLPACD
jgi:hypothetical protein